MFGMNGLVESRDSIIYVTSDWSGLKDVLLEKGATPKGMPAFFKPLVELNRLGVKVELIVLTSEFQQDDVSSDYFTNTHITVLPWPSSKSFKATYDLIYSIYKICAIIKSVKPFFVYSLGPKGVLGTIAAKITNTPVGVRVFGINTYYEKYQAQGELKFALKSPLFYLMFKLRSNFILATNDGSPSDLMNQKIGRKDNVFECWENGFDFPDINLNNATNASSYLIYPSRISKKKQQLEVVKILEKLHYLGHNEVKLLFAGHLTDKKYWEQIERYIEDARLSDHVQYLGSLDKQALFKYMHEAICVISIQKVSNLSNIVLEALSCNAVVLSFREPALCRFLEHGKSAILINDVEEGAFFISKLMQNARLEAEIRVNGRKALEMYIDTWDERIKRELNLIWQNRP